MVLQVAVSGGQFVKKAGRVVCLTPFRFGQT
jgi:hypothetical protein